MTDIVDRLRSIDHMNVDECFLDSHMYAKAADEIERLRRVFLEAVEALEHIAAEAYVSVDEHYPMSWRGVAVDRINIAREFLEKLK